MASTSMVGAVDVILCGPGEGPNGGVLWIQQCAGLWPQALLRSWASLSLIIGSQPSHRAKGLTKGPVCLPVMPNYFNQTIAFALIHQNSTTLPAL